MCLCILISKECSHDKQLKDYYYCKALLSHGGHRFFSLCLSAMNMFVFPFKWRFDKYFKTLIGLKISELKNYHYNSKEILEILPTRLRNDLRFNCDIFVKRSRSIVRIFTDNIYFINILLWMFVNLQTHKCNFLLFQSTVGVWALWFGCFC